MSKSKTVNKSNLAWQQRVREVCLILSVAVTLFILIALFSYHRADPGWSHLTTQHAILNAGGRVGAWLADFFLTLFGYFAYIFPFLLCYAAWLYYRHRFHSEAEKNKDWLLVILRTLGFLLILIALTCLASLHISRPFSPLPDNAGGIIGSVLGGILLAGFNSTGSTLILFFSLLIGISLFTGLSWFKWLERLGALVLNGFTLAFARLRSISLASWLLALKPKPKPKLKKPSKLKIEPTVRIQHDPVAGDTPAKVVNEASQPLVEEKPAKRPKLRIVNNKNNDDDAEFAASLDRRISTHSDSEVLPTLSLLDSPPKNEKAMFNEAQLEANSREVELRLADFGVETQVVAVHPGPVVTRYELQLAAGTKVSKITALAKDLARSLSVISVRIVEVIPGKSVIGIELPNDTREVVNLQMILASKQYQNARSPLTLALGKDIAGHPVIADLAKMPHLLVAGTTGSGKSVGLNAMLLSLLYKSSPKQLRLILIDPKMLELAVYEGIPHLLTPVVTDMKDAATALRWCVAEMERRYRLMASLGVRNIAGYNQKIKEANEKGAPLLDPLQPKTADGETVPLQQLPQIVVLADEFADMMVVVGKKVETLIARLAQKARAAGIHLIFATQRPSVDVITGLIKANIPARIAFQVSSKVDSRTILDQQGAEQLLGNGDMLYLPPGTGLPVRVHGAYVHDDEVHRVVDYLKQYGEPEYISEVLDDKANDDASGYTQAAFGGEEEDGEKDPLYDQAVDAVVRSRKVSISSIQRRFKIGYNRAANIVEAMEMAGVVSQAEGTGAREVLAPPPRDIE